MGNTYQTAVGLFDRGDECAVPQVSVAACGDAAAELVKTAIRFAVPVVEDPALARSLSRLEIDAHIPEDLFAPVAAVLAVLERRTAHPARLLPTSALR